jgi:hypothetical protein
MVGMVIQIHTNEILKVIYQRIINFDMGWAGETYVFDSQFDNSPVHISKNFKIFHFYLCKILSMDVDTMRSKFKDLFNKLISKKRTENNS